MLRYGWCYVVIPRRLTIPVLYSSPTAQRVLNQPRVRGTNWCSKRIERTHKCLARVWVNVDKILDCVHSPLKVHIIRCTELVGTIQYAQVGFCSA